MAFRLREELQENTKKIDCQENHICLCIVNTKARCNKKIAEIGEGGDCYIGIRLIQARTNTHKYVSACAV